MKLGTYEALLNLLPQLVRDTRLPDPVVTGTRLYLMEKIEAALAADQMTFADLPAYLMQPAFRPGDLLLMVETITRWDGSLTDNAVDFLADLKRRGRQATDDICLTPRQSEWLSQLYRRALTRRSKAEQQQTETAGDNVIYLRGRV